MPFSELVPTMTLPILLAFCASSDRERVLEAANRIPLYALFTDAAHAMAREVPRPLILLAVGHEGGAALARWVDAHRLDGVAGIGLVGVTAPLAEPRCCLCHGGKTIATGLTGLLDRKLVPCPLCKGGASPPTLPLGPLEPLRKVAERARRGNLCPKHFYLHPDEHCEPSAHGLNLVIAAAPDDGVCPCLDMGGPRIPWDDCGMCNGTGKVLSSADVSYELTGINADGSPDSGLPPRIDRGGVTVRSYETRAALTDHGLRTVIETLTR